MFVFIWRIIKFSFQDILRNIWLSIVTVLILILTLLSVNLLIGVQAISTATVETIKDKVDISLYLDADAPEDRITSLKARISVLENVQDVRYISQAEALQSFQARHQNDPKIIEALQELDKNPLTPSLVIIPKDTNKFDELIAELNRISDSIIESRNFDDHKAMLAKIDAITNKVSDAGFLVSSIFIFISLLVIFNTVRVAIYTHRNEIGIMRLVGASDWFIRSPFLISSLIYTLVAMIVVIIVFYAFLTLLHPYLQTFFVNYNFNIIVYFSSNFMGIFGLQFIVAAIVNLSASLLAVGKYSKV
ncbi:MAG: permease-like cell division protein FtsX [bacterium]